MGLKSAVADFTVDPPVIHHKINNNTIHCGIKVDSNLIDDR